MDTSKFSFPSETITLPSKGKLYPESSPLSKGEIEMKYMTAKEEDILTNVNYLQNGTVIDRLLQSLILTKGIDLDDLLAGDKNAILLGARILGYGKDYEVEYNGKKHVIDLSEIDEKPLHPDFEKATENRFTFKLPASGVTLEFKLLTGHDEKEIDREVKGLKKLDKDSSPEGTVTLKHQILSVDGDESKGAIYNFVDNYFITRDTRAFRKYLLELQPDVDLKYFPEDRPKEGARIPIGIQFFWPDAEL